MPDDFQRKQTLVGAERFVTPRLKELEERILAAREAIGELEASLFRQVCAQLAAAGDGLQAVARTSRSSTSSAPWPRRRRATATSGP